MLLNPGEGVIIQTPSAANYTVTCIGELLQTPHKTFPPSNSIRSSLIPQLGQLDTFLSFPVVNGDVIYRMTGHVGGTYSTYTYSGGAWSPFAPTLSVGESFWIYNYSGSERDWQRVFYIWY